MFAAILTGRFPVLKDAVPKAPPIARHDERRPDTSQDVRSALTTLRQEFPQGIHVGIESRDIQDGMLDRVTPAMEQNAFTHAALGLFASGANFTAGFLGASILPQLQDAAISPAFPVTGNVVTPKSTAPSTQLPHSEAPFPFLGTETSEAALSMAPPLLQPSFSGLTLQSEWIAELNVNGFDTIAFLRACGQTIDDLAPLQKRLDSAYQCFRPIFSPQRSVLSTAGLDGRNLSLFFERLLPVLGLGKVPLQGLDPAFAQALFSRWFLSLASPSVKEAEGNGHDKNSGFQLESALLNLTRTSMQSDGSLCANAPLIPLPKLKTALLAQFASTSSYRVPGARQWAADAIFSVFEPTLMRHDAPAALRYGSLEWAMLDIGIRLAGPQHWLYTHIELIGLTTAVDIFGDTNAGSESMRSIDLAALGTLLRMAHAQQAIDLRDIQADKALQIAVALFRSQIDVPWQSHSITGLLAALPLRSDTTSAILKENGFDPTARFIMTKPGRAAGLLGSQSKQLPCLDFGISHSLVDFVMAGCIGDLLSFGAPSHHIARALEAKRAVLALDKLQQRFQKEFDAAFTPFSSGIFSEALQATVSHLSELDVEFWRCGKPTIGIPAAEILTKIAPRRQNSIPSVTVYRTKYNELSATKGLLIRFELMQEGKLQERNFWVTRDPLAVGSFNGNGTALVMQNPHAFFEIDNPHEQPIRFASRSKITYRSFINAMSAQTAMQFIASHLLEPLVLQVRALAYQRTAPELTRARLHHALSGLLPLAACADVIAGDASLAAPIFCALDVMALIPVVAAGVGAAGSVARVGASLSGAQLRELGITLVKGTAAHQGAIQTVTAVLNAGVPVLDFAMQAAHWLNPLDGIGAGFSWLSTRLGRDSELIMQRLRNVPALELLTASIKRHDAERKFFYPDGGFWHAASDIIIAQGDLRHCELGGKKYSVINMGGKRDILALQQGRDLRLANPRSGLPYGPTLSLDTALGMETRLAEFREFGDFRSVIHSDGVCRVKRADELLTDRCLVLIRPPGFGTHAFRFGKQASLEVFHVRIQSENSNLVRLVKVDLNANGFSSYGVQRGRKIENGPYFGFDGKLWKRENNRLTELEIPCPFPDQIEGSILYPRGATLPVSYDGSVYISLSVEMPYIAGDPVRYFNRFIVPFGNYPGLDGACMGMTLVGNLPYQFKLAHGWKASPVSGQRIVMEKAGRQECRIFTHYQALNELPLSDFFIPGTIRQFKTMDDATRHRFDTILQRTEKLLTDAAAALMGRSREVEYIVNRFIPRQWSAARVMNFKAAMLENLTKLRSALPMLIRHKYEIIGLGSAKTTKLIRPGEEVIRLFNNAVAYSGSMTLDMDFSHINKPLITYDEKHFSEEIIDTLAADLIHELSHARFSSRDTMSLTSHVDVYPDHLGRQIDIAPLLAAAAQDGSDSANHAATIEQFMMTLAYTQSDDTKILLEDLLDGGTCFSYREDVPQAGHCFGAHCVLSIV